MDRYTIFCTEEQTKKALNLGAPLEIGNGKGTIMCRLQNYHTYKRCIIPTAEQMIGWLEEQGMQFNILSNIFNEWEVIVYTENTDNVISEITDSDWKKTKKEATIVAIDASLEYLSNNKKLS